MPALVVPRAGKPSWASTMALPGSHALGMRKPVGAWWSALKSSAFCLWVAMVRLLQGSWHRLAVELPCVKVVVLYKAIRKTYGTRMDTEALETFVAVHREQGFSRAARVLNRTQPAISRRISLLGHELGAPLFERVTGGIVLSQAGRVLLPYAERALAAVKDATEAVRGLRAEAGGPG